MPKDLIDEVSIGPGNGLVPSGNQPLPGLGATNAILG